MPKSVSTSVAPPLCAHLDHLVDELRAHIPAALQQFDSQAVHKARVATRRLKAALDLLETCIDADHAKPFEKIGRKLRRRLGPLRDADVMLGHLNEIEAAPALEPGIEWMRTQIADEQRDARECAVKKVPVASVLAKLGTWWGVRQDVIEADEAIPSLLAESLHLQLDRFIEHADHATSSGADETAQASSENGGSRDPHQLRIAGKALRYTLELAEAQGKTLPDGVLKGFKQMQDCLGGWHDFVVLAQRAMEMSLDEDLPLHDAAKQRSVIALVDLSMSKAEAEFDEFTRLWHERGPELARNIRETFTLTQAAQPEGKAVELEEKAEEPEESGAASESKTDPDPSGSGESQGLVVDPSAPPPGD